MSNMRHDRPNHNGPNRSGAPADRPRPDGPHHTASGQAPGRHGQNPAFQDPAFQDPTFQDPAFQDAAFPDPYAQDPYVRDPYAQNPYPQDPYAQDPYVQDPAFDGAPGWQGQPGPVGSGNASEELTPDAIARHIAPEPPRNLSERPRAAARPPGKPARANKQRASSFATCGTVSPSSLPAAARAHGRPQSVDRRHRQPVRSR
ncbi:hypothetical protein A7A08_02498 [Methyloligella halotolerans]|uniref:Uncharacterized protein n=1 Tax=Methyloligella halotolerans TaxID=1177755 RepID=A0A1E2RX71_9HYPH|nr:hypothetical protein A7A08_02498 [Methyloligella halotolerans]